ncbi:hypothetical protein KSX_53890 [Ktedonospora formicarum]|uniref:Uncharacterized protein n=1 Tax=Ktedonospora formicarum TaxID=2778364 RepID=A0A8J3I1U6_9CHLR|nr:hypothetical protein KSX_53890 [Ktedonospora formicarum]
MLLSTCRVFADFSATLLMRHEYVTLYAEEEQIPGAHQRELAHLSTPFAFVDG